MKFLLWLIVLAALAVGIAALSQANAGYAVIVFPPYQVDLSLNIFIICLLLTVGALYLLLRLIVYTVTLPSMVGRWRSRREQTIAKKQGYLAILALLEGRFLQAEKAVGKALLHEKNLEARVVVLLTAAKAAHMRRDFAQRDFYLAQVELEDSKPSVAANMLKAEMLADEQRNLDALRALSAVRKVKPKLTSYLFLELRLQQREGNTARVIELANRLEKQQALDPILADRIRQEAYLQHVPRLVGSAELKNWWDTLPLAAKQKTPLVLVVAKYLGKWEDKLAAVELIEKTLDRVWDTSLLDYYGRLDLQQPARAKQLQKAEGWLKVHPNDSQLLLALGRLCIQSSLWGKAQSYLEASLAILPTATAHAELGHLLEHLEQTEEANLHYRQGLALSVNLSEKPVYQPLSES